VAIRHPELVRKLVIAASAYGPDGVYPEVLENIRKLKPEDFEDSPWLDAYTSVAPDPEGWPTLLGRSRNWLASSRAGRLRTFGRSRRPRW
jgi:hypothetical protein